MWTANGWFGFNRQHMTESLDKVGKEDDDIDNDGDVDSSDKYLHNRRKEIGKAIRKEDADLDEAKAPKIACVKCDEVATQKAWEKNHGTCPHCKVSTRGVSESFDLEEAVAIDHSRYMRSHGKKARDTGQPGKWMFTSKEYGDVDHGNAKEFHSAHGNFADAKKSAQKWAKEHGHYRAYVMESAAQIDEISDKKLDAYRQKAFADQPTHDDGSEKYRKRKFGRDLAFDKQVGRAKVNATKRDFKSSNKMDEAVYHDVDWDGASKVKVIRHDANEIDVRRVDKNHKELPGDDHAMTYTKSDPEFREIKSKLRATDDHDAWKEKRAASLQGRKYHEEVELDESALASLLEATVAHGPYEITTGRKLSGMGEGEPSHVHAHQRKMNKLGVPQHPEDDYGDTVSVTVKDSRTGDKTYHHVYQRGFSEAGNKEGKKVVSVRTVGHARPKSAKHNDVIKNYLSGKHFKTLKEQWIEDMILTSLVEEALASKRTMNEMRVEKDLEDHEPRVVHGYKGMKQRPFSKKFKSQDHMEKWLDSDSSADHEIHTIEKA